MKNGNMAVGIGDRIIVDVTNELDATITNVLGGEVIDENILTTIVEILSEGIRIAVIQATKMPPEEDQEIEILGEILAKQEEGEIRPLLTMIGRATSAIMSISHLGKNVIDVANPNRLDQTDRGNSTEIKIRKRSDRIEMMARTENSAKQEENPPTMPTTGGLSLSMHAPAREIAMIK